MCTSPRGIFRSPNRTVQSCLNKSARIGGPVFTPVGRDSPRVSSSHVRACPFLSAMHLVTKLPVKRKACVLVCLCVCVFYGWRVHSRNGQGLWGHHCSALRFLHLTCGASSSRRLPYMERILQLCYTSATPPPGRGDPLTN